jgi:hypothetical protein
MRYPCDRLAAFMAHCLNSEDSPLVQVNPGALYARLTEAIAARYAEPLLHHPGYAWRLSAEEAAARYFDISLSRRLLLSGKVDLSIAHRLFEAMCRRGAEPAWRSASLQRELAAALDPVTPLATRGSFDGCARRLSQLPETLSAGSASKTIRARSGAVSLRLGNMSAPVPEEMSTWDAITCGPDALYPLASGDPFNRFCGLMIDCVRTAHRLFQELLGLGRGLCPFDWIDVLTIQQTRALRKFLSVLDDNGGTGSDSSWAIAWSQVPVPGFKSAESLRQSDIGLALRHAIADVAPASPIEEEADESSADAAEYLSEQEFQNQLRLLQDDGVISAAEHSALAHLHRGVRLAAQADFRAELRRRGLNQTAWLADIQSRIERWPRLASP